MNNASGVIVEGKGGKCINLQRHVLTSENIDRIKEFCNETLLLVEKEKNKTASFAESSKLRDRILFLNAYDEKSQAKNVESRKFLRSHAKAANTKSINVKSKEGYEAMMHAGEEKMSWECITKVCEVGCVA